MRCLFFVLFSILSFGQIPQQFDLYENYKKAVSSFVSTAPCYVVLTFKNVNDNSVREVCVEAPDLIYAILDEKGWGAMDQDKALDYAISNQKRYFEFSNAKSIERLNTFVYSAKDLEKFVVKNDINVLSRKIFKTKKWKYYPENELEKIKYAHSLFKFGIITRINNCTGGMTLFCANWSTD